MTVAGHLAPGGDVTNGPRAPWRSLPGLLHDDLTVRPSAFTYVQTAVAAPRCEPRLTFLLVRGGLKVIFTASESRASDVHLGEVARPKSLRDSRRGQRLANQRWRRPATSTWTLRTPLVPEVLHDACPTPPQFLETASGR